MHSTVLTAQERDAVAEAMPSNCTSAVFSTRRRDFMRACCGSRPIMSERCISSASSRTSRALTAAALELNSGWVDLLVNHALILNGAGRHDAALASAERAIAIDPAKPDAVFQRGNALIGLDRPAEALAAFEGALALNPRDVDAMVNRGLPTICGVRC
jgi:tetratricopeptide (TPR) repeat protein